MDLKSKAEATISKNSKRRLGWAANAVVTAYLPLGKLIGKKPFAPRLAVSHRRFAKRAASRAYEMASNLIFLRTDF